MQTARGHASPPARLLFHSEDQDIAVPVLRRAGRTGLFRVTSEFPVQSLIYGPAPAVWLDRTADVSALRAAPGAYDVLSWVARLPLVRGFAIPASLQAAESHCGRAAQGGRFVSGVGDLRVSGRPGAIPGKGSPSWRKRSPLIRRRHTTRLWRLPTTCGSTSPTRPAYRPSRRARIRCCGYCSITSTGTATTTPLPRSCCSGRLASRRDWPWVLRGANLSMALTPSTDGTRMHGRKCTFQRLAGWSSSRPPTNLR